MAKQKGTVVVVSPEDGGWPRDPARIARNGPNDFTIDPDGHTRYVMVEVVNPGATVEQVTLRGFVTHFGRLKDKRVSDAQYLYVKSPDDPWRRVYRQGNDMAYPYSPLVIAAPPGRTRVCTVVDFTVRDYVEYVESLSDPRLTKEVVLTSGGGTYKVYRIRITNPGGKHKLRIAFCKTNHAYEQSGFYMAQGIISWLLSGDRAANLDHVEWTIYPCLDPQAVHDGGDYDEYDALVLDDGRTQEDALWNPVDGELPSQHYHVITDEHMWEIRDYESFKYNDPFAPSGPAGNGKSDVEAIMLGFWPYWYEFGIDAYDHENKWQQENSLPEDFGGALVTHLEIPYYGKDDVDPQERLREQGRMWARSHSQTFLHLQRERGYWTSASPAGPVDLAGAVFLPIPETILIEALSPLAGAAQSCANGNGGRMQLYRVGYDHGVGMRAGDAVTYAIPDGANTFRAMVGVDDAEEDGTSAVRFTAAVGGRETWRSRALRRGEREMAFFNVVGGDTLILHVSGPSGMLGNWGGAKFTRHDPERPDSESPT